jgi:hypothetical protein
MSTTIEHACVSDEGPIRQIIESLRKEEQAGAVSIRKQHVGIHAEAVTKNTPSPSPSLRALDPAHGRDRGFRYGDVLGFEHLEALPHAFDAPGRVGR